MKTMQNYKNIFKDCKLHHNGDKFEIETPFLFIEGEVDLITESTKSEPEIGYIGGTEIMGANAFVTSVFNLEADEEVTLTPEEITQLNYYISNYLNFN